MVAVSFLVQILTSCSTISGKEHCGVEFLTEINSLTRSGSNMLLVDVNDRNVRLSTESTLVVSSTVPICYNGKTEFIPVSIDAENPVIGFGACETHDFSSEVSDIIPFVQTKDFEDNLPINLATVSHYCSVKNPVSRETLDLNTIYEEAGYLSQTFEYVHDRPTTPTCPLTNLDDCLKEASKLDVKYMDLSPILRETKKKKKTASFHFDFESGLVYGVSAENISGKKGPFGVRFDAAPIELASFALGDKEPFNNFFHVETLPCLENLVDPNVVDISVDLNSKKVTVVENKNSLPTRSEKPREKSSLHYLKALLETVAGNEDIESPEVY